MLQTLGCLVVVGALWGCTNPFIRRGTRGLRAVHADSLVGQARAELAYLLGNWQYVCCWVVNQLGSLVYLVALRGAGLALAVPVANSLALVFTALVGAALGEARLTTKSIFGIVLIVLGTTLCYMDKLHDEREV